LDENWVEERLRYKLIMGLILTAREFIQVNNAKVVIALRRDLLDRVFRLTRDSGFQEEKYQGLYLPLTWTKQNLLDILDQRVQQLVKRRYTKQPVTYTALLPKEYHGQKIEDYLYSIAKQPRDIIAFFNSCILAAIDKHKLSVTDMTKAVKEYSRLRLRALGDEWYADYPTLLDFARILNSRPLSFKVSTIVQSSFEDICLNVVISNMKSKGLLIDTARSMVDGVIDWSDFYKTLFQVFYRVGLIGLKTSPDMTASWANDASQSVTKSQIDENTSIVVATKYAIALGVHS
ncbi:MAG: P-loop ATPase, Sll1717 family, partial [Planctomycetota bacterium]